MLIRYNADVNPPAGGGRRDGALEVLRRRIDAIQIDRAPFERIDAYVRAACGRLAPGGDEPVPFVEES